MALRDAARGGARISSGSAQSVKRIQRELKEISDDPSRHWTASPVEDDLFEWKFAVRGPPGTDFEGGIYTGRLVLPNNYPLAPPSIMLLTPNGRWEVGKKICLSNSSYHPELWQPAWGIRTMMEALRSHFPVPGDGAIASLDWPSDLRKKLAKDSLEFTCPPNKCKNRALLPELTPEEAREDLPEPPVQQPTTQVPVDAVSNGTRSQQVEHDDPPSPAPMEEPIDVAPSGIRFRGASTATAPEAKQPVIAETESIQANSTITETTRAVDPREPTVAPEASASSSQSSSSSRRRDDGARAQRRPQPLMVQLIKPPRSRREWVLLIIDVMIMAAAVTFVLVFLDLVRNPPDLLNQLPDTQDAKS